MEKAKIMVANTCASRISSRLTQPAMDTDKIKIFGAKVTVDGTGKLAEIERAEKVRLSLGSPDAARRRSKVIDGLRKRGVPAYAPVFDS